jgi:hypothetical protein
VITLFACARKDTFKITQITSTFSPRFEKRLFLDANVVGKEAKQRCYFSKCSFAFFLLKCSFTLSCARSIICTQLNEVPTSLILKTPFESLNNKTDFLPSLFFSPISTYITCLSLFNSVSGFKFFSLCVPTF